MIWDKHAERWNQNYRAAEKYWREHGNLDVPRRYVTSGGIALGVWVDNQRSIAAGKKAGAAVMSERQKNQLNQIGMIWKKEIYQNSISQ